MKKTTSILNTLILLGLATTASALVVENPPRAKDAESIDPKGVIIPALVPHNSATKDELIAIPTFRSVQVFGASGKLFEPKQNFLNFTGTSDMVPDVELTFGGPDASPKSGEILFHENFSSSDKNALRLEANPTETPKIQVVTAVLRFGDYNTDAQSFAPATVGSPKAPMAVAFTLTAEGARFSLFDSIVVVFKDAAGNILDTQSLKDLQVPKNDMPHAAFFAFKSSGERIASVEITATTKGVKTSAAPLLGFDDLGFDR